MRKSQMMKGSVFCSVLIAVFFTKCANDNLEDFHDPLVDTWDLTVMTVRTTVPIQYTVTLVPGIDTVQGVMTLNSDSGFTLFLDVNETFTIPVGTVQIPVPIDTTMNIAGTWTSTDTTITLTDPVAGAQTLAYKFNGSGKNSITTSGKMAVGTYAADLILTWAKQ